LFGGAAGADGIHIKIIHELVNFIILLLVLLRQSFSHFMAGKKKRSVYRKSKKGRQFTGLQRYVNKTKTQENVLINEGESSVTQPSTSSEIDQPLVLSASRAKLKRRTISSSSSDNSDGGIDDPVEGYRLVNVAKLASVLSTETHVCEGGKMTNLDCLMLCILFL
jgi:glucan-binding YG repeat protein